MWPPKQQHDWICVPGLQAKKNKSHSVSCIWKTVGFNLPPWHRAHVLLCFQCFGMSSITLGVMWKYTVICIACSFHRLHICSTSKQPWNGIHIFFFLLPQSFVGLIFSSPHLNSCDKLNYAYTHPKLLYLTYGSSSTKHTRRPMYQYTCLLFV